MSELTVDIRVIGAELMADVIEQLNGAVELLKESHDLFDKYATAHIEKGTEESYQKAQVNVAIASKIKTRLLDIKSSLEKYNA